MKDPDESSLDLLARARAGDHEALRAGRPLSARLQRWASGRLPRWTRDLAETDDLVQDSMLQTLSGSIASMSSTRARSRPTCARPS